MGRGLKSSLVFVRETIHASSQEHYDCWVRLTDFPFLILGSRWYRGIMVGKPQNLRTIRLRDTSIIKIHSLTKTPRKDALCFGDAYRLAFDRPASPVAEFEGDDGEHVFVATTELYRSHYLGIPRAQAGLLHGLHKGGLDNPLFEAWDPSLTTWTNERIGIARIAPAKFLQANQAVYLARLLFSESGRRTLDKLHNWVLEYFTQPESAYQLLPAKLLPIPSLPYPKAVWEASVVPLPTNKDGRPCLLVTHIESFEAPEPYVELERVEPRPPKSDEDDQSGQGGNRRGEALDPIAHDPVDNIDDGWDPALEPVAVASVLTIDKAARRRVPTRILQEPLSPAKVGTRVVHKEVATPAASTQTYGPYGSGVVPMLFSDEDLWPKRDASLEASYCAIRRAAMNAVHQHLAHGISAEAVFLPDKQHAYAFEIRHAVNSRRRSAIRQFIVANVQLGSRHGIVIEPQRRSDAESIPLGIVWRTGENAYGAIELDDIREIVRHLEDAVSEGKFWTRLKGLSGQFKAVAVWHPASTMASDKAVNALSSRILTRLLDAVGDVRVLANLTEVVRNAASPDGAIPSRALKLHR